MSDPKYVIGIDWGEGERAVGLLIKVEGEEIGVVKEFELSDREVTRLTELKVSRDFVLPGPVSYTIPITKLVLSEKLLRAAGLLEEEPRRLNRAERRKQKRTPNEPPSD